MIDTRGARAPNVATIHAEMPPRNGPGVPTLQLWFRAFWIAYQRINLDDGWAIASHIALSALMAIFPFFILLTSIAAFFGTKELADAVANLMLATWPKQVSDPISNDIHNVLTTSRSDLLTIGAAFALYFASSGIESLRIGLNRAYGMVETRNWLLLRLESIGYVLIGAVGMLALGFLIVLGPLIFATALRHAPWLEPLEDSVTVARYGIAVVVLVVALVIVHKWLPHGRRKLSEILPGIFLTLILWMLCGITFGRYLASFASNYVTYYSSLASAMIALVFLYFISLIFVYGGEFNAAIRSIEAATKLVHSRAKSGQ
jgi:membrane protein